MVGNGIFDFSLVFGLAAVFGLVAKLFRQPSILGYVIAGIVISGFSGLVNSEGIELVGSFGVMLLLFVVGMELSISELMIIGRRIMTLALLQVSVTVALVAAALMVFGVGMVQSVILGILVSFSSTILAVKLLSEKRDTDSLMGKIATGVLLVQDMLAIGMIIVLRSDANGLTGLVSGVPKMLLAVALTALFGKFVISRLVHFLARDSSSDLVVFSLAWCFVAASLLSSKWVGLSLETGGFIAGLVLANSLEKVHIVSKVRSMRDFFLTVFFVTMGAGVSFSYSRLIYGVLISIVLVVFKLLLVWILARILSIKQRVSFGLAVLLSQVSEFGFIVMAIPTVRSTLGVEVTSILSIGILFSMLESSYLVMNFNKLYTAVKPLISKLIPESGSVSDHIVENLSDHVVLFGCHRMGRAVLEYFEKNKIDVLVVDFDPEVVEKLRQAGKKVIFADASDTDVYDLYYLNKAKMVVSTVRDVNDSLIILREIGRRKIKVPVVVDAESLENAKALYASGASYVVFPHFVSGLHLSELFRDFETSRGDYFERKRLSQQKMMDNVFI